MHAHEELSSRKTASDKLPSACDLLKSARIKLQRMLEWWFLISVCRGKQPIGFILPSILFMRPCPVLIEVTVSLGENLLSGEEI